LVSGVLGNGAKGDLLSYQNGAKQIGGARKKRFFT
jgi:hypothetical protein